MCKAPRAVKTRQKLDNGFQKRGMETYCLTGVKFHFGKNRNVLSYLVVIVIKKSITVNITETYIIPPNSYSGKRVVYTI